MHPHAHSLQVLHAVSVVLTQKQRKTVINALSGQYAVYICTL